MRELTTNQLMRYNRHISLKDMDIEGQEALWNSKVLLIGVGGLGCAVSQYLTASGVGKVTLVDDDIVEQNNLQRQVLYKEKDIGVTKVDAAKRALYQLNSEVIINTLSERLTSARLAHQIQQHDLVLDCSDNLPTRNEVNQFCVANRVPLVSGAAIRMEGQVCVFDMKSNSPCYYCLSHTIGNLPNTCTDTGVLSPLVGLVGTIQAIEAIKMLAKLAPPIVGQLLTIDAKTMDINSFKLKKLSNCPVCS